jgi:Na+-translocating ferredoxin:NAD+ oxidoreductase subunit G
MNARGAREKFGRRSIRQQMQSTLTGPDDPVNRMCNFIALRPALRRLCAATMTLGWLLTTTGLQAERYLTVVEAQRLCFPQAEQFEEQVVRFTSEQKKAIEKKSGVKVRNLGNRLWVARQGTNWLGVLIVDHVLGKHEIIDYALAVAPEGRVLQIEVLEFRESHGYEIRSPKWRDQFRGKNADSKLRLHADIYNISGATLSCRAVTDGIKRLLATHELVVRPRLGDPGRLQDAAPAPRH